MAAMTLEEWVSQFRLQQRSRALWKAIRWEFEEQAPPMTVRQMFYRMSAQGVVPKSENGYRTVQNALKCMREQQAIPYGWIADNTRWVRKPDTYTGLADLLLQSKQFYRRALWHDQPTYIELWLEKDALAGVVGDITAEYDVPLYVTRGYPSLSYLYEAAESLKGIDKPIYIYHFGDYDASGKDAARAIREGLTRFGAAFHFQEVAVTEPQITSMNLQTRPAKKSDPRAKSWGTEAVELDAIPPTALRELVRAVIEAHLDPAELARLQAIEEQERATLDKVIANFLY